MELEGANLAQFKQRAQQCSDVPTLRQLLLDMEAVYCHAGEGLPRGAHCLLRWRVWRMCVLPCMGCASRVGHAHLETYVPDPHPQPHRPCPPTLVPQTRTRPPWRR